MKVLKHTEKKLTAPMKNKWHAVLKSSALKKQARPSDVRQVQNVTTYSRHPKPPYTYVGMITAAIWSLPNNTATVEQIYAQLQRMFSFFRGPYVGWKSSVRHFLSLHECFEQIQDPVSPKKVKLLHWRVIGYMLPRDAFLLQNTKEALCGTYEPHLMDQVKMLAAPKEQSMLPMEGGHRLGSTPSHCSMVSSLSLNLPPPRRLNFEVVGDMDLNNNIESVPNLNHTSAVGSLHSQHSCASLDQSCVQQSVCHNCYDTTGLMLLADLASHLSYI